MCGYEYTARLQRMLVDMTLSSTLVSEFHDLKIKDDALSIGFSTLVLQVFILCQLETITMSLHVCVVKPKECPTIYIYIYRPSLFNFIYSENLTILGSLHI